MFTLIRTHSCRTYLGGVWSGRPKYMTAR